MSKRADLEQLIALGEGQHLEFERSGTSHLGREICAMANALGGLRVEQLGSRSVP